jgi:hypothetical protein
MFLLTQRPTNIMKKIYCNLLIINLLYLFACTNNDTQTAEKFIQLNTFLENQDYALQNQSEEILALLKKKVEMEGLTQFGRQKIKQAELLKRQAMLTISEIDKIKLKIIREVGKGIDEETVIVNDVFNKTGIYDLFIDKPAVGKQLIEGLTNYRSFILKEFSELGFDNENTPSLTEDNPNYLKKYFGNTTVIEALALLTERQHQIHKLEIEVLNSLISWESSNYDGFNEYILLANIENDSLNVGDLMQMEVYAAQKLNRGNIRMKVNDKAIEVKNNIGIVKFKVQGKGWQTWRGEVVLNNRGRDTSFFINQRYFVMPK